MRVLVVAHRTATTPKLLAAVRARASSGDCTVTLLIPRDYWDPDTDHATAIVELAVPLLEEAAGGAVEAIIGDSDPFVAVQQAVAAREYDEIIVSTLPERVSRWLHRDLPTRARSLGPPVTVITAEGRRANRPSA